jgi:hypothetical protein
MYQDGKQARHSSTLKLKNFSKKSVHFAGLNFIISLKIEFFTAFTVRAPHVT